MNVLFVHQNFPGQYLHIVRRLVRDPTNKLVFISESNANRIEGVHRAFYQPPKPDQASIHPMARDWDLASRRAELVATAAGNLKRLGFTPDIIIGHHGWGELLNLPDVWPGVPILGYFEFYYDSNGQDVNYDLEFPVSPDRFARIRAMNTVNLMSLALEQHGQTPTKWQHTRYPEWAQARIGVLPEGVPTGTCAPNAVIRKAPFKLAGFEVSPKEKLVTFVARNLEPYRGFHVAMRALPRLLAARPDLKVIMVGGDDVSYGARLADGSWREHFQKELAGKYDAGRVLFAGQIPYPDYLRLLQRSDAHLYLSYPFVASWSLREALAAGCVVVASDVEPVREFVTDDKTGVIVPGLDHDRIADTVLELLDDQRRSRRLRKGARVFAEAELSLDDYLGRYEALIAGIIGQR